MATAATHPASLPKRWFQFTLGLVVIWTILFVIGPLSMNIESVQIMARTVENTGIESGALYWSDVEVTGTAEAVVRATIKYPPKGP